MALIGSNSSSGKELNELWHRRMGHLHHGALKMLREIATMVPDLDTEHDVVCRGCVLGMYATTKFPRSDWRADGTLGLIHSDICGLMSTRALSGAQYFVIFIYDHSRKTLIYFLKTKDEVFDRFREFKALMENVTGKKIKVLRSDNGGEYIDKNFIDFCAKEGIKREWTTLYNPKKNGVAEWKNRTIVGATNNMLYDEDLPRFLWAKECNMTIYIHNKTPHRALGKKTPKGVFTGKKPKVSHFRIFGSVAYFHMLKKIHTKLD